MRPTVGKNLKNMISVSNITAVERRWEKEQEKTEAGRTGQNSDHTEK